MSVPQMRGRELGLMLCASLNAVREPTATQAPGFVVALGLCSVGVFGGDSSRPSLKTEDLLIACWVWALVLLPGSACPQSTRLRGTLPPCGTLGACSAPQKDRLGFAAAGFSALEQRGDIGVGPGTVYSGQVGMEARAELSTPGCCPQPGAPWACGCDFPRPVSGGVARRRAGLLTGPVRNTGRRGGLWQAAGPVWAACWGDLIVPDRASGWLQGRPFRGSRLSCNRWHRRQLLWGLAADACSKGASSDFCTPLPTPTPRPRGGVGPVSCFLSCFCGFHPTGLPSWRHILSGLSDSSLFPWQHPRAQSHKEKNSPELKQQLASHE